MSSAAAAAAPRRQKLARFSCAVCATPENLQWMRPYEATLRACFALAESAADFGEQGAICDACVEALKAAFAFRKRVEVAVERLAAPASVLAHDEATKPAEIGDEEVTDDMDGDVEKAAASSASPSKSEKAPSDKSKYEPFQCSECSYSCMTSRGLVSHVSKKHAARPRRYGCKICGKVFARWDACASHVRRTHAGFKPYPCADCGARFADYASRNRHAADEHARPARRYVCAHCGRAFERASSLAQHVRRDHVKFRPFACATCAARFFTRSELARHAVHHLGVRDFRCDACGKSYFKKSTLTEHMKIHLNVRAHVCHVCGKDFVQKCSLMSHLRTH